MSAGVGPVARPEPPDELSCPTPVGPARRRVSSQALFRGFPEIIIVHAEDEYRLRITKRGKLILTK